MFARVPIQPSNIVPHGRVTHYAHTLPPPGKRTVSGCPWTGRDTRFHRFWDKFLIFFKGTSDFSKEVVYNAQMRGSKC